jgi:hypothetical protein
MSFFLEKKTFVKGSRRQGLGGFCFEGLSVSLKQPKAFFVPADGPDMQKTAPLPAGYAGGPRRDFSGRINHRV